MSQQRTLAGTSRHIEARAIEQAAPRARLDDSKLAAEQPDASPLQAETALRIVFHLAALLAVVAFLLFYCVAPVLRDLFF